MTEDMIAEMTAWLRAVLDERERLALAAKDPDSAWWWDSPESPAEAHIARHNPDWVLADVAAKRRILGEVVDEIDGLEMQVDQEYGGGKRDLTVQPYASGVLVQILAEPYAAQHPGYREEWKP